MDVIQYQTLSTSSKYIINGKKKGASSLLLNISYLNYSTLGASSSPWGSAALHLLLRPAVLENSIAWVLCAGATWGVTISRISPFSSLPSTTNIVFFRYSCVVSVLLMTFNNCETSFIYWSQGEERQVLCSNRFSCKEVPEFLSPGYPASAGKTAPFPATELLALWWGWPPHMQHSLLAICSNSWGSEE